MSTYGANDSKTVNAKNLRLAKDSIETVDRWIRDIQDPELGNIGKAFLENFKRTGCREQVDFEYKARACYSSFSYRKGQKGFVNTILYGPSAQTSLTKLFSAKVHEVTHALQIQKSAALHADPFNPATRIIVCPRDWITLQERCEENAYVHQALFNSLLMKANPDIQVLTDYDSLSVAEFDVIRSTAPNIGAAFNHAALQSLNKNFYMNATGEDCFKFGNHYQYNALEGYRAGLNMREGNKEKGLIFVRITPEDIMDVGSSFGLNSFSGDENVTAPFFRPSILRPRAQANLAELNKKLGITDEALLPTLAEALDDIGLDMPIFLECSRQRKYKPPSIS